MNPGVYFVYSAAIPSEYLSPGVYTSPALIRINTVSKYVAIAIVYMYNLWSFFTVLDPYTKKVVHTNYVFIYTRTYKTV